MKILYILTFLLILVNSSYGQFNLKYEEDKCGHDDHGAKALKELYGNHWGYSYDSLLEDLPIWEASDYVQVSSIGQSTLGREVFELTISDFDDTKNLKHRIYIHTRTHPNEVQSFWVTSEIINYLTAESSFGDSLREHCIFHIVPMYNPDGVELEKPRENANDIDIESNWDAEYTEVEVENLRNRFSELMMEPNPIEVALNMHAAYGKNRYFVCHHENGTSDVYFELEKIFIESVRYYFYDGIEPYSHMITWSNGTPTHYPESWWWINHEDEVMALTYEDMNDVEAGFYDKTAYALLNGIANYLGFGSLSVPEQLAENPLQAKAFPNPFTDEIIIEWSNFEMLNSALVYDIYGRKIAALQVNDNKGGRICWKGNDQAGNPVPAGAYMVQLVVGNQVKTVRVVKV